MRLTSEDISLLHRPSYCELRPRLAATGMQAADPSPFDLVIRRLGKDHETAHLATLGEFIDLSVGSIETRATKTLDAISSKHRPIYQGVFTATVDVNGIRVTFVGIPDFLIPTERSFVIRDSKLALHADEEHHPEILLQLHLYGWLYARCVGQRPDRLEVLLGSGELVQVSTAGIDDFDRVIESLVNLKSPDDNSWEAVGWSKCSDCPFHDHCWPAAIERGDTGIVPEIDQSLSKALKDSGIESVTSLLDGFSADSLSEYTRPWGSKTQKVGKKAHRIILQARAIAQNCEIDIASPVLPQSERVVALDLEGMPQHLDEAEKIYLWGLKLYSREGTLHKVALADFGENGEEHGWSQFLEIAKAIFDQHGDIPFLHWSHYEKTKINRYIEQFGDNGSIGTRILKNLVDMLPITRNSVVLPIPSYSLKVVEKHIGFVRSLPEANGQWSMAKYIEAVETSDQKLRDQVMGEIVAYNHEDLDATWAVYQWLKARVYA